VSLIEGVASFTTSALSVGNNTLTAAYSGDLFFAGSSSPALVQVINATPVTLAATNGTSATTNPGGTAVYPLTLAAGTAQSQTISLTCSNAPTFASCTISPSSVSLNGTTGTTTVTVQTQGAMAAVAGSESTFYARAGRLRWGLLTTMLGLAWVSSLGGRRRRRRIGISVILGCVMILCACGGGSSSSASKGIQPGSYVILITAQSNVSTQAATLKLTLNVQ
jgi:Bacterial Ig-like domain (group 3)